MKIYRNETGYLQLLRDTLDHGHETPDRTGVGRKKLFSPVFHVDLRKSFPAFTVRANNPVRIAFEEFWFFLRGGVQTKELEAKKVSIWKGNTTREFLDGRGLTHLPEGHYGKAYGFQFRHASGQIDESLKPAGGIDQLAEIFEGLRKDPFGSRHCLTLWNPAQIHEMALPPCWYDHQFVVLPNTKKGEADKVLNLRVTARSCDLLFGTPLNIFQYALYLAAMAKAQGMVAGELTITLTDAHLYGNQYEYARETVDREIFSPAQLQIDKELNSLEDLLSLQWEDIKLHGYRVNDASYKAERPPMAV